MGFSRQNVADMDDATENDLREVIRAGLRRFYHPVEDNGFTYQWNFLDRHHPISAVAAYKTGTIAVSGGTLTLTSGTLPPEFEDYFVVVSGQILFVNERLTDTTATVNNDQIVIAAGTSYTAKRYKYGLPADFNAWRDGPVYMNSGTSQNRVRRLARANEAELTMRYAIGNGGDDTTHFAVTTAPSGTFHITLWPVPIPNATILGTYQTLPDDSLETDLRDVGVSSTITQVTGRYAEALLECVLAAAESYTDDMNGVHEGRAQMALKQAIAHDRAAQGPMNFNESLGRRRSRYPNIQNIDFTSQL
jgi:hypothetical protein